MTEDEDNRIRDRRIYIQQERENKKNKTQTIFLFNNIICHSFIKKHYCLNDIVSFHNIKYQYII